MSDGFGDNPFGFAFGDGAAEEFKEKLMQFMRAQKEAFDEVQAAAGGQMSQVERWDVISKAVELAAAGLRTVEPTKSPDDAADAMGIMFARAMTALQGALNPPE